MDTHRLQPHPSSPSAAIDQLRVEFSRPTRDRIHLRYIATGRIADLAVPDAKPPERTDELWRTTCFELFLRPAGGTAYREFNFSPSGQWAAYAFDGYRGGMRDAELANRPAIARTVDADRLTVDVTLALDLPDTPHRIGLTAVIEGRQGAISYWALAHAEGQPDFHTDACLAAILPPPERP